MIFETLFQSGKDFLLIVQYCHTLSFDGYSGVNVFAA